jgi:hypothetical protein
LKVKEKKMEEEKNQFKIFSDIVKSQIKYIKFDVVMISHFFGRWIPYAFAIGIITGSLAAFMDFLIISINSFLSENLVLLIFYPLVV